MFRLYEDPLQLTRWHINDYKTSGRSSTIKNTPKSKESSQMTYKLNCANAKKVSQFSVHAENKESADLSDDASDCQIYGSNLIQESGQAPNFLASHVILKPVQQYFSVAKLTHSQENKFCQESVNERGFFTARSCQSSERSSILLNDELGDQSLVEGERSQCKPNLSLCLRSMASGSNKRKIYTPSQSTNLCSSGAPKQSSNSLANRVFALSISDHLEAPVSQSKVDHSVKYSDLDESDERCQSSQLSQVNRSFGRPVTVKQLNKKFTQM